MHAHTGPNRRILPLAHPAFGCFWLARGASAFAFQMQVVAVGWQVYALTHSTLELGFVGLAQFLPMLLCTLPAGHVADLFDRRTVCAVAVAVQAVAFALLARGALHGWPSVAPIFGLVALIGAARSFERPATQALLPSLVPIEIFPTAIVWSSSLFQMASIAGPAIGGFVYAWSRAGCYLAATVLAVVSTALFVTVRPPTLGGKRPAPTLASLLSGVHYIRGNPVILGSISLDLFAVLLGGAAALLPAFARDILRTGAWGLGVLRAAPSAGSLAMSAILVRHPLHRHVGRKMFAAVLTFGAATILFGLSRNFGLSVAALVVLGAADMISVVIRSSLVQLQTPDEMRGRVSAVNGLFIGTSNQLGEFESGVTAAWFGTVPATVLGGIGTLVVAALWMRRFPALARYDRLDGAAAKPPGEPAEPSLASEGG